MAKGLPHFLAGTGRLKRLREDPFLRRLAKNASWLLSGTAAAAVLSLVGSVIRARALGPELFGILALVASFSAIVGRLATMQPWQSVIKFGAAALEKGETREFAGVLRLGFLIDCVGAGIAALVSLLGAFFLLPHIGWDQTAVQMAAVFTIATVMTTISTPIAVLRLLNRFHSLAIQNIVTSALSTVGALVCYLREDGIWAFLMVQMAAQLIGAGFLLYAAWRALRTQDVPALRTARVKEWRPVVSFSLWTSLTSTINLPVKQLDVLMVGSLVSVKAAGIYKIVKQVVTMLGMFADPVYQACYPQFAGLVGAGKESAAVRYAWRLGLLLLIPIAPVGIALAASGHAWIPAVFGEAFSAASTPLAVFLAFAVLGLAALPVHPLFWAFGYARTATAISVLSNSVFLVVAVLSVESLGLVGFGLAYGLQVVVEATAKAILIRTRRSRCQTC